MKRRYPKQYYIKKSSKAKKFISLLLVTGMLICLLAYSRLCIYPTVNKIAESKAQQMLTDNINAATDEVLFRMIDRGYESYVNITRDSKGDISLIELNFLQINTVIMDMSNICQDFVEKSDISSVGVPIGAFTGSLFFAGAGKEIGVPMRNFGISNVTYTTSFEEAGINQTKHFVYIEVEAYIDIIFPLKTNRVVTTSGYVLCENVIVGKVPDVYLNGLSK